MKWKRLRGTLWRRADWSVARFSPGRWKLRLPSGRYISKFEVANSPDHALQSDEACEQNAASFSRIEDAQAWLDEHYPTEEVYDVANG